MGGFSALQSGLAILPESVMSLLTAVNTARMIRAWGHRRALLTGLTVGAVGLVSLGLTIPLSYPAMVVPLMLLGFSFGATVTVASDLVLTSASADRVGAATGISETSFELGTALGIAITGSVVAVLYSFIAGGAANFTENVDNRAFTLSLAASCVVTGMLLAGVCVLAARALRDQQTAAA